MLNRRFFLAANLTCPGLAVVSWTSGGCLTYKGKKLATGWVLIGDFDYAMQRGMKLVGR